MTDIRDWYSLDQWRLVLVALLVLVFTMSIARNLMNPDFLLNSDGAFYAHAGWDITEGATPYLAFWDVKPPLVFEWSALLALFGFDNPGLIAAYHIATTIAVAAGSVLLVEKLTRELTGSRTAAFCAASVLLVFPGFHFLAAHGFRPKYFALCFGLLALHYERSERPLIGGACGAVAAGFWQFGAIFPLVVAGLEAQRTHSLPIRSLSGMGVVTILVVAPMILMGALEPMLVEVIVAPFVLSESWSLPWRLWKGVRLLGFVLVPVCIGVVGIGLTTVRNLRNRWWLGVLAVWYGIQIFYLDFDGFPDLLLGLAIVAFGFGVVFNHLDMTTRKIVSYCMVGLVILNAVLLGGVGVIGESLSASGDSIRSGDQGTSLLAQTAVEAGSVIFGLESPSSNHEDTKGLRYKPADSREQFWGMERECHYFMGKMGSQWIVETDGKFVDMSCYE